MRSILVLLAAASAETTHVVVAGSGSHALGVVACVRSVFEGALNQVKVHVIVQRKDVNDFQAALRCALPNKDWRVVPWEDDRVARLVSVRHGKKGYLAHALNYARFYLREILPSNVEKALWLDSDTVVIGDVTSMVRNALTRGSNAVAAVAREKKACGTHFLNCSNPERVLQRPHFLPNDSPSSVAQTAHCVRIILYVVESLGGSPTMQSGQETV